MGDPAKISWCSHRLSSPGHRNTGLPTSSKWQSQKGYSNDIVTVINSLNAVKFLILSISFLSRRTHCGESSYGALEKYKRQFSEQVQGLRKQMEKTTVIVDGLEVIFVSFFNIIYISSFLGWNCFTMLFMEMSSFLPWLTSFFFFGDVVSNF